MKIVFIIVSALVLFACAVAWSCVSAASVTDEELES